MESAFKLRGKKKVVAIVLASVLSVAIIAITVLFMPIPMAVDWNSIEKVGTTVRVLDANDPNNITGNTALVKEDNSPWKVLQFTDMHLSEGIDLNKTTLGNYVEAIKREKPDLVTITGDVITSTQNRVRAIQFCNVMEKLGIYWCYCLGNHEGDNGARCMNRKDIIDLFASYDHCLVDNSQKTNSLGETVWGYGNYVVNLLDTSYNPIQSLIFMDSGDAISSSDYKALKNKGVELESDSYDFIKKNQVVWYTDEVNALKVANGGNVVKSIVYIHIPLYEQRAVSKKDGTGIHDPNNMNVDPGWNLLEGTYNFESVNSPDFSSGDDGLYAAMKANNSTQALFCGHDHINTSVIWEDRNSNDDPYVFLCYNQPSGYATYTLTSRGDSNDPNDNLQGYGVLAIQSNGKIDFGGVKYSNTSVLEKRIVNSTPYED